MKRLIFALGVLYLYSCTKTEAPTTITPTPNPPVVVTPPTVTVDYSTKYSNSSNENYINRSVEVSNSTMLNDDQISHIIINKV